MLILEVRQRSFVPQISLHRSKYSCTGVLGQLLIIQKLQYVTADYVDLQHKRKTETISTLYSQFKGPRYHTYQILL